VPGQLPDFEALLKADDEISLILAPRAQVPYEPDDVFSALGTPSGATPLSTDLPPDLDALLIAIDNPLSLDAAFDDGQRQDEASLGDHGHFGQGNFFDSAIRNIFEGHHWQAEPSQTNHDESHPDIDYLEEQTELEGQTNNQSSPTNPIADNGEEITPEAISDSAEQAEVETVGSQA